VIEVTDYDETWPVRAAAARPDLIQELTDRARADRGLPLVPVWEE
jgi:hypothetical protein